MDLWMTFLHLLLLLRTGGVSMRRCGVDAMRTSSECDVRGPELDDPRGLGFLLLDDLQGCHRSRSRLCIVFCGASAFGRRLLCQLLASIDGWTF